MRIKTIIKAVIPLCVSAVSSQAVADNYFEAIPTGWRLQNYIGSTIVAAYTPSNCSNGTLNFSASATQDDKNRFWTLIMSAKLSAKTVGIFYETSTETVI